MSRYCHNLDDVAAADAQRDETGFLSDIKQSASMPPQWSGSDAAAAEAALTEAVRKAVAKRAADDLAHPSVLQEADAIIHGERQEQYGDPERNFERIAQAWSAYLDQELSGHDVCMMMGLLKIIRAHGDYHRDSLVDLAGYAGLAAIAAGDDE